MGGSFLRGALVSYTPALGLPLPNVIVFQFNPETITHSWTQAEHYHAPNDWSGGNPLAAKGTPPESCSFKLSVYADSVITGAPPDPIAAVTGIYSRLAALEMLLYPTGHDPLADLVNSVSSALGAGNIAKSSASAVPLYQVPTVFFIWGVTRIVPVRVSSLTITEKLYDIALNPTYAEAQITLNVLSQEELNDLSGTLATLANAANTYTQGLRAALAIANLANSATSIIGMIP